MKKKILLIVVILVIFGVLGIALYNYYMNIKISKIELNDELIKLEYGESYKPELESLINFEKYNFINKDEVIINSNLINEEGKDYPAVDSYEVNVKYKNRNLIQKIIVEDSVSPIIEPIEKIEIPFGTNLNEYDFDKYIKIKDLSDCEKYNIDLSNVDSKKSGEYTVKISVKDKYDNLTENEFNIVILEEIKEEIVEEKIANNTITSSQSKTNSSNKTTNKVINKIETNSKVDTSKNTTQNNNSNQTTSSIPTNNSSENSNKVENKQPTQNDLSYWCMEGGSHHVAGDGANEHGYYSSWDAAYQAFENFTKDWDSVQFKVSQCACGKYYFWAIK